MAIPKRATSCRSHHSCPCQAWYLEQLELALKIIKTWSACDSSSPDTRERAMLHIEEKCSQALQLRKVCFKEPDEATLSGSSARHLPKGN